MLIGLTGLAYPVKAGGFGESLLRTGVGARAFGMGRAVISVVDDGTAAYWNPAGLAQIRSFQISGSHAFLFRSLARSSFINAAIPLKGGYTLGLSWLHLDVDNIPLYNAAGGRSWPVIPGAGGKDREQVFTLSLARMFTFEPEIDFYGVIPIEMPVAMNVKYLHQAITGAKSHGAGVDLGMMARVGLQDVADSEHIGHVAMGLTAHDITGTYIRWNNGREETVKPAIRMGFSYTLPMPYIDSALVLSEQNALYHAETLLVGGEFWHRRNVAVRFGCGSYFTAGVGLNFWFAGLDYAFINQGSGDTHRISASFNF
jgi:hypothetical protein